MKRAPPPALPDAHDGDRPRKRTRHRNRGPDRNRGPGRSTNDAELEPLETPLLQRMVDFLDERGGTFDYGSFAAEFAGVKKKQLEPHFDFHAVDGPSSGRWDISLRGAERPRGAHAAHSAHAAHAAHAAQEEERGRIRYFDRQKGYGFIRLAGGTKDTDVFFPRVALPQALQDAGDRLIGMPVSFPVSHKDGKPRTEHVTPLDGDGGDDEVLSDLGELPPLDGEALLHGKDEEPPGLGIRRGSIVRFEEPKGYGFVRPDDGGEDVFFLREKLPRELAGLRREADLLGAEVEFDVDQRADGKLRSRDMVLLCSPPTRERSRSRDVRDVGQATDSVRVFGRIVSYEKKGYGFINSPDEPDDIFFLSSTLPKDLQEACRRGENVLDIEVYVDVVLNEEGKPRALQVFPAYSAHSGRGDSRRGGEGRRNGEPEPLQTGTIVAYDITKGYGFVMPDDGGEDAFYVKAELPPELTTARTRDDVVGNRVEFELRITKDGKLRAHQMTLLDAHADAGPRVIHGRIKRYDRARGYGFVMSPGEQDAFFLPSALPKQLKDTRESLEGMEVSYEFFINEDGKPRAAYIQPAGQAGRGEEDRIHLGNIVAFDTSKGYGFIFSDDFREDIFFLRSELPSEFRDVHKEKLLSQRVEFELYTTAKGALRARRVVLLPPERHSRRQDERKRRDTRDARDPRDARENARDAAHARDPRGSAGAGRWTHGRIVKYDKAKGYGFAECSMSDAVFVLRSCLPAGYQDSDIDELRDVDLSFEVYEVEEGKPRARNVEILAGALHRGRIVRFDPRRGYGFLKPEHLDEDIYFLQAELPSELANCKKRDEVEGQPVEFEVLIMPDGKLRGQKLVLAEGEPALDNDADEGDMPQEPRKAPLEDAAVQAMTEFLADNGGSCDWKSFNSQFPGVRRKDLKGHFNTVYVGRGVLRVGLPEALPSQPQHPEDPSAKQQPVDKDEPAIPLGPGCQPNGVIHSYDASKGFGFLRCEGIEENIFFPRAALPESFRGRHHQDLPPLVGVHVCCELEPVSQRGPRTDRLTLLLKWHEADRCWLLRRD